jgi:endogenous inhibitor of DNA gyrase (YacG/DUF329 family)
MPAPMCVYCRQHPAVNQWQPFCSERCRQADLGRWLQGDYRVPGSSVDSERADSEEDEDAPGSFGM